MNEQTKDEIVELLFRNKIKVGKDGIELIEVKPERKVKK